MDQVILSKNLNWEQIGIFESKFQLKKALENGSHGLFTNRSFKKNETIFIFHSKNIVELPTYLTVQIEDNKHFTLDPEFLQYMNHSCNPNVFLDTKEFKLIALRQIAKDDELSFFYPSTEWDMDQPFICNCGARECQSFIAGANSIKPEVLLKYRLNEFIKRKLLETQKAI